MKRDERRNIWFQRRFVVGLTPVSLEGYALTLFGLGGGIGLMILGDVLGKHGKGDLGALANLVGWVAALLTYGVALLNSADHNPY